MLTQSVVHSRHQWSLVSYGFVWKKILCPGYLLNDCFFLHLSLSFTFSMARKLRKRPFASYFVLHIQFESFLTCLAYCFVSRQDLNLFSSDISPLSKISTRVLQRYLRAVKVYKHRLTIIDNLVLSHSS